jgi:hypothetical protein
MTSESAIEAPALAQEDGCKPFARPAGDGTYELVIPFSDSSQPLILPYAFSSEDDVKCWLRSRKGSSRIEEARVERQLADKVNSLNALSP